MQRHGLGLKDIPTRSRSAIHVLTCFEQAMLEPDAERVARCSRSSSSGAGRPASRWPVRLSELIRLVLVKDYPRLNIKDVRVLLLEATDKLLAAMPERLREAAGKTLWRKYVEVRFGASVADYDGDRIRLNSGEVIPAKTVIGPLGCVLPPSTAHSASPRAGRAGSPSSRRCR